MESVIDKGNIEPYPLLMTLRKIRRLNGLSVMQFAQVLEVAPSTIYGWESGRRKPSVVQLAALGDALGLSHGQLGRLARSWRGH